MKQFKLFSLTMSAAIALSGLLAFTSQDVSAQLVDGGFELGALVDDGVFVGKWNPFADGSAGNTSDATMLMPRNGEWSLELNLVNANGFAGVGQDVAIPEGTPFTYSVWHKETTMQNGAGVEMRVEYFDSVSGDRISDTGNTTPASLGSTWELLSISDVIPAGADTARVVYAIQSFGGALPQQVFVDDVTVEFVPEPASMSLIGIAGLALLGLRRRSK